MSATMQDARTATYELEIPIAAPRERVWKALTEEPNAWWLPEFHMVGADSRVRLEPRAGGHLIEEREGGGSLVWYTVQMCTPGEALHMCGHVFPQWGGPSTNFFSLLLEESGDGTLLRVQDAHLGRFADGYVDELRQGWNALLGDGLRAYVED